MTQLIWEEKDGKWGLTVTEVKQWVGLTDEEINLIYAQPQTCAGQYAKAIEAKLKEKNT